MGMNFGGLGFGFEAEDTGAEKTALNISTSLDKVWDSLQKVGPAAMSATRKMTVGFGKMGSFGNQAFGGISLALTSAIESAQNPTLSSAYESMFAGFGKSFKAMTAGMNMSEKEAKKMQRTIGNVAFSLNEDMDGAAKSWKAFRQQNVDLTKILGSKGTKGAIKDLIKVTSVYGIEGEQLAGVFGSLVKGFDFTEERAGSLADKVFYLGRHFNMGNEAVQAWPAILESLNQELADFGREAKPEDIEKLTTSIVALGGGLQGALGLTAQGALEMSRSVFTTLMGERKGILNMLRGMGGEMSEFGKQLAETGGSVQGMFQMINEDPAEFMNSLRKMTIEAEKRGGETGIAFQRLSGHIMQALGPDMTYAAKGGWDKVQESMAQVPGVLEKSGGAFTKFAKKAHSTGLTTQEGWDRMMEGMRAKMMRISGPARKQWVKEMKVGFDKTTGVIQKMADDRGPIGKLTQRLLLVKDVGLSGLFSGGGSIGKLSTLFGGLATSMLPALTALGAMGVSFSSLGKMALGGGVLYGLFHLLENGPEKSIKALKELGATIWAFVSDVFPGVKKLETAFYGFKEDIEELGFGNAVKKALSIVDWKGIANWIKDKASKAFGKVFDFVSDIDFKGIFKEVGGILSSIDFGGIFKSIGGAIKKVLSSIDFKGIFKEIGSTISGVLSSIDFKGIFKGVSQAIASVPWGDMISSVFVVAKSLAKGAVRIVRDFLIGTDWGAIASAVGKGLMAVVAGAADLIGGFIKEIFTPSEIEGSATEPLRAGMLGAFSAVLSSIAEIATGLVKGLFSGLWKYAFDADSVSGGIGRILKVVVIGFTAFTVLSKKFRANIFIGFRSTFSKIRTEFAMTGSKSKTMFKTMKTGFKSAAKSMKGGLKMFGGMGLIMGLVEAMDQVKVRMKDIGKIAIDELIPDMQKTALIGEQGFMGLMETLDSVFMGIPSQIGNALGISSQDLSNFYHEMVAGFEKGIVTIVGAFDIFINTITSNWSLFSEKFSGLFSIAAAEMAVVWEKIKLGWIITVNKMKGAMDTLSYGISRVMLSVEHTMESAMHAIMKRIASAIDNSPLATDAMEKWRKEFMETDREMQRAGGLEAIQRREHEALDRAQAAGVEARKARELEQIGSIEESESKAGFKALELESKLNEMSKKKNDRNAEIMNNMARGYADIDRDKAKNKKASAEFNKKEEKDSKSKKGRKRGGKGSGSDSDGGNKGKGDTPGASAQAAARAANLPPGMAAEVQSLTGNVSNLTRNMSDFVRNPLKVEIKVDSKLKKALRFDHKVQGRAVV